LKAVVLAAGEGTRLRSVLGDRPKPLLPVKGKPLIRHVIDGLASCGISEVLVVVGYNAKSLIRFLKELRVPGLKVRWTLNDEYQRGNGVSLAKALLQADEKLILTMSDHLFERRLLEALIDEGEPLSLAVDRRPKYLRDIAEATKVLVSAEGYIVDIGKHVSRWNAVDTGFFIVDREFVELAHRLSKSVHSLTLSDVVRSTLRDKVFKAVDVTGCFWMDVDMSEDLMLAEAVLPGG